MYSTLSIYLAILIYCNIFLLTTSFSALSGQSSYVNEVSSISSPITNTFTSRLHRHTSPTSLKTKSTTTVNPYHNIIPTLVSSTSNVNITNLFQIHTMGLWFSSISLVSSITSEIGLDYFASGGDWENPPYFFYLAAGSMDTGDLYYNITNIDPGNIWPRGGKNTNTGYSGINFNTFTTNFADFTTTSAIPVWSNIINSPTDNVWETGPAIQMSNDNSLIVTAATLVPNDNPLGTKFATIAVMNTSTYPTSTIFTDNSWPNATGFELLHVSDNGKIVVMVSAIQNNDGSIHTSLVRIYNIFLNLTISSFITPYAFTGCLSPDGHYLVLGTTDSEDRIDVYYINETTLLPIVNSSYPTLPGTFQYIATCRVNNNGLLMSTFAIFWGDSMNQSAVGSYQLQSSPMTPPIQPLWLYLTTPSSDTLQDTPEQDILLDDIYIYTSWGGTNLNGTEAIPTVHIYNTSTGASGPIAEIITYASPLAGGPNISGSLGEIDIAYAQDGTNDIILLSDGQDGHANIGSYSGAIYSWRLHFE